MSWITFVWALVIGACVTMVLPHLVIGIQRRGWENLFFAITALAVARNAFDELVIMRAGTPEEMGRLIQSAHVSLFFFYVGIIAFVSAYFGTGRLWLGITAFGVRLFSLVVNFNAFEAMAVIRADARQLLIHAKNGGGEISVSVRDFGPGLSGALSEQLFEPFFTTKTEGTGMGLAIARSIIEEHGGTLLGENCDEGGACFTVRLPTSPEEKSKEALPR